MRRPTDWPGAYAAWVLAPRCWWGFALRSPRLVAALLGVLKAGGAYVPLDPSYPAERLSYMLEDARVGLLLTEERLLEKLPRSNAQVLCLDRDQQVIDRESAASFQSGVVTGNTAYVLYTSGSTGKPKGVQVTHAGLTNLLLSMRRLLSISQEDCLLAVTTLSFDIAALEIFLPLLVGACVEIVDRDEAADGVRLAARLDEREITFLQATPASWRMLLEAGWQGKATLTMLCGGEALPRTLADRLVTKGQALWNLYGPTETTIWSSACQIVAGEPSISIGKPIANTRLLVLDKRLRVVPIGVIGELYIGGMGLARGYLGRPSLTAERFIPDPFGLPAGGRLYRTGDLARRRPDGTLECLGRVDHQVKIRGFRVELGEIEAALTQHPGVSQAVVTARPDSSGEMSLAAYVVPRAGDSPASAAEWRRWLVGVVPEYMVPTAFVMLEALPMTPNGKIDRQALPDPELAGKPASVSFVPPRGPIEEAIAELWTELLGDGPFGAHDSFFDRGGHSLLAVRLLARIRQTFDVETPLKDFLEEPTLARLARLVEQCLKEGTGHQAPPIEQVHRQGPLPASFAQQRLWYLDQLDPGRASYNIPVAVRLAGRLDLRAFERALNETIRRHEVLRTILVDEGGIPHQVIMPRLEITLVPDDLSALPEPLREGRAVERLREEAERPFDLARGPLIRAGLLRLAELEHIVIVVMHHAVSDGWSVGILIREMSALYEAFRHDQPSPLPEPSIQYADYAVWQRNWLTGDVLQAHLDYWTRQLGGLADLDLPTDRPRPLVASQRGGERSMKLGKSTLEGLRSLGRQEGTTLYMTLLAAFQVLLHRHSGQEDFAVGTPIAARTQPELEDLIGFFVSTLVMRGDLSGDPSFRALLKRLRQTAIEAYAHQDLPFEMLVTVLQTRRDPSRSPLFQVMFALQNAPLPALQSPELQLTPLNPTSGTSKFDLTLFAVEEPQGLHLTMEYSTDLFEAATVDRMLDRLAILVEEIIAYPDRPIGALNMLSEEERRQAIADWNAGGGGEAFTSFDDLDDEVLVAQEQSPEGLVGDG